MSNSVMEWIGLIGVLLIIGTFYFLIVVTLPHALVRRNRSKREQREGIYKECEKKNGRRGL